MKRLVVIILLLVLCVLIGLPADIFQEKSITQDTNLPTDNTDLTLPLDGLTKAFGLNVCSQEIVKKRNSKKNYQKIKKGIASFSRRFNQYLKKNSSKDLAEFLFLGEQSKLANLTEKNQCILPISLPSSFLIELNSKSNLTEVLIANQALYCLKQAEETPGGFIQPSDFYPFTNNINIYLDEINSKRIIAKLNKKIKKLKADLNASTSSRQRKVLQKRLRNKLLQRNILKFFRKYAASFIEVYEEICTLAAVETPAPTPDVEESPDPSISPDVGASPSASSSAAPSASASASASPNASQSAAPSASASASASASPSTIPSILPSIPPLPFCGNGKIEAGEACDGDNMNGYTCNNIAGAYSSGTLTCSSDCKSFNRSSCAGSKTTTLTECDYTSVSNAVGSAQDGETIILPPKTCPVWNQRLVVDASSESISLKGSGKNATVIETVDTTILELRNSPDHTFEISDLKLKYAGPEVDNLISIPGTGKGWRIHNLNIETNDTPLRVIRTFGATYGVIDNVSVTGPTSIQFLTTDDSNWTAWQRPYIHGSDQAVFIENCNVNWSFGYNSGVFIDGQKGGRAVIRNSTFYNTSAGNHGLDSGYGSGHLALEIYNNRININNSVENGWSTFSHFRGGTGTIYNNNWDIADHIWLTTTVLDLAEYRNDIDDGGTTSWPFCTGQQLKFCSNMNLDWSYTGNRPFICANDSQCAPGDTCSLKLCSNKKGTLCKTNSDCGPDGGTCSAYVDGSGSEGYPCYQQIGFNANMQPDPWYEWGNTWKGAKSVSFCAEKTFCIGDNCWCATCPEGGCDVDFNEDVGQIQLNRDYFIDERERPNYFAFACPHPVIPGDVDYCNVQGGTLNGLPTPSPAPSSIPSLSPSSSPSSAPSTIPSIPASPLPSSTPLGDDVVAHYDFFGSTVTERLSDKSGNNNDLTFQGDLSKVMNGTLVLSDDTGPAYAYKTSPSGLPGGGQERTIMMRARFYNPEHGQVLAGYGTHNFNCQNFQLGFQWNQSQPLDFMAYGWGSCDAVVNNPTPSSVAGSEHHIALTYNNGNVKLFVNGQETSSATSAYNTNPQTLCIGGEVNGSGCDRLFKGAVREFTIYDRELNGNTIQAIVNGSPTPTPSPRPSFAPSPSPSNNPQSSPSPGASAAPSQEPCTGPAPTKSGNVITAQSCQFAAVQRAVCDASDNQIVRIPGNTCTWQNSLYIDKGITLQGAGIGNTVLVDNTQVDSYLIQWNTVSGKTYRMTDIEFAPSNPAKNHNKSVVGLTGTGSDIRMDHLKFQFGHIKRPFWVTTFGLADHNIFENGSQAFYFRHSGPFGFYGHLAWEEPIPWGSPDFFFVENNKFLRAGAGSIDGNAGARVVFRHNTLIDSRVTFHGTETFRGGRAMEVYGNKFKATFPRPVAVDFRSGSGLIYNNEISDWYRALSWLNNYRNWEIFSPWGSADGTMAWDGNDKSNPAGDGIFESGVAEGGGPARLFDNDKNWNDINNKKDWTGYILRTVYKRTASSGGLNSLSVPSANWTDGQWDGWVITKISSKEKAIVTGTTRTTLTFNSPDWPDLEFSGGGAFELSRSAEILGNNDKELFTTFKVHSRFGAKPFDKDLPAYIYENGHEYEIRKLKWSMDQPGRGISAPMAGSIFPKHFDINQVGTEPLHQWNNTLKEEKTDNSYNTYMGFIPRNPSIITPRDFTDNIPKAYTPFPCPHPRASETSTCVLGGDFENE